MTNTSQPEDDEFNYVIAATGKSIPEVEVPNSKFLEHEFYTKNGSPEGKPIEQILEKFESITGIKSRRYAREDQVASDLGAEALDTACESSGIELESIDLVIGVSNYFDVKSSNFFVGTVPGMGRRVLSKLGYDHEKGKINTFDLVGGCPGFLEGEIASVKSMKDNKDIKRVAVVAMETLSRVSDPHDKDSLIYSDGAGAVIIDAVPATKREGIIAYDSETIIYFKARTVYRSITDTAEFLKMGPSNNPDYEHKHREFLKMIGPNVAELAKKHVPEIVARVLEQARWTPDQVDMFPLHQANRWLDHMMALGAGVPEEELMRKVPIILTYLGNSSVATIPILIDMIAKGELTTDCGYTYSFEPGHRLVKASVGASMNVDALAYLVPEQGLPYKQ